MHFLRSILFLLPALAIFLAAESPSARAGEPVELQHRWGTTRLDKTPERIVSLSFIGNDFFLALGVQPVAFRYWYGGNEQGVWPWAEEALGASEPVLLRGEIDVEAIAMLKPDLIEALWSGISEREYRQLSKIAPVLAPKAEYGAYGTPWQEITRTIGKALRRPDKAASVIGKIERHAAAIRSRHPEWQGRTAVVGWPGGPGFYMQGDVRAHLLESLGLGVPRKLQDLSLGSFYVTVSPELTDPYDADVLIWLGNAGASQIKALPLRHTMRAYREGREIVADPLLGAAMSFSSPLSLDYALDRLEPLIAAAIDGDPATPVPSGVAADIAPEGAE